MKKLATQTALGISRRAEQTGGRADDLTGDAADLLRSLSSIYSAVSWAVMESAEAESTTPLREVEGLLNDWLMGRKVGVTGLTL